MNTVEERMEAAKADLRSAADKVKELVDKNDLGALFLLAVDTQGAAKASIVGEKSRVAFSLANALIQAERNIPELASMVVSAIIFIKGEEKDAHAKNFSSESF